VRGDVADAVSFKTPSCEPDAPLPPKLHARTINSIMLKWNVCSDITLMMYYALNKHRIFVSSELLLYLCYVMLLLFCIYSMQLKMVPRLPATVLNVIR